MFGPETRPQSDCTFFIRAPEPLKFSVVNCTNIWMNSGDNVPNMVVSIWQFEDRILAYLNNMPKLFTKKLIPTPKIFGTVLKPLMFSSLFSGQVKFSHLEAVLKLSRLGWTLNTLKFEKPITRTSLMHTHTHVMYAILQLNSVSRRMHRIDDSSMCIRSSQREWFLIFIPSVEKAAMTTNENSACNTIKKSGHFRCVSEFTYYVQRAYVFDLRQLTMAV